MILRHRDVKVLFTTPRLLEALSDQLSIPQAGIKGVFCGGTTITPQTARFICKEVLEGQVTFVPTYGNTLMGLAASRPDFAEQAYSICYHAPQPRALLRVVDPDETQNEVDYDGWGRVELTTLTHEFFMPRFLERDEARRRRPCALYPWDGVAEVRPFSRSAEAIVEGVY
jgi:YD repeat-containing protein